MTYPLLPNFKFSWKWANDQYYSTLGPDAVWFDTLKMFRRKLLHTFSLKMEVAGRSNRWLCNYSLRTRQKWNHNSNDVAANKTKLVGNFVLKYIHFAAHLCGPRRWGNKMKAKCAVGFPEGTHPTASARTIWHGVVWYEKTVGATRCKLVSKRFYRTHRELRQSERRRVLGIGAWDPELCSGLYQDLAQPLMPNK